MPRPKQKSELIALANANYQKMNQIISEMSDEALKKPFDFTGDPSKKEAHWGRDKNPRDILIHLYEWHQLLLFKFIWQDDYLYPQAIQLEDIW